MPRPKEPNSIRAIAAQLGTSVTWAQTLRTQKRLICVDGIWQIKPGTVQAKTRLRCSIAAIANELGVSERAVRAAKAEGRLHDKGDGWELEPRPAPAAPTNAPVAPAPDNRVADIARQLGRSRQHVSAMRKARRLIFFNGRWMITTPKWEGFLRGKTTTIPE